MRTSPRAAMAVVAMFALPGCMSASGSDATPSAAATEGCEVTVANEQTPPGEMSGAGHHGNGSVWTAYEPSGVLRVREVRADGSLAIKFPWWIASYSGTSTMAGELEVSGRRIDGRAKALTVEMPCCYTGGFQASTLVFPSAGCWRIHARPLTGKPLTFVVRVVH